MRIIDKNTDFYDYFQNIYQDNSLTFDRTDSFVLTKKDVCDKLYPHSRDNIRNYFCLLQVCNKYWLFLIEVTKTASKDSARPTDFTTELLDSWANYSTERKLCNLSLIKFGWEINIRLRDKQRIKKEVRVLVDAINTNNYEVICGMNSHTIYLDGWYKAKERRKIEKHIPLLKASGFANCINPLEIYLAFEEYFSIEKASSERTESVGLTDKEKVENHGFDLKRSFRSMK